MAFNEQTGVFDSTSNRRRYSNRKRRGRYSNRRGNYRKSYGGNNSTGGGYTRGLLEGLMAGIRRA